MHVQNSILNVLRQARLGSLPYLTIELPPKLGKDYGGIKRTLQGLDCEWDTHLQTHVFAGTREEALGRWYSFLNSGELPKRNPLAFFATPPAVAAQLAETVIEHLAERLTTGETVRVLEPHGGSGALLKALRIAAEDWDLPMSRLHLHTCEIDPGRRAALSVQDFQVVAADFLGYRPAEPYHAILANPPFSTPGMKTAWSNHSLHALDLLAPGGLLVTVLPAPGKGLELFADTPLGQRLAGIDYSGELLEKGTFRAAGTDVSTWVLTTEGQPNWRTRPVQGYPSWYAMEYDLTITNDSRLSGLWQALETDLHAGVDITSRLKTLCEEVRLESLQRELINFPLREEDLRYLRHLLRAGDPGEAMTAQATLPMAATRGNQPSLL